jgi:hypothetical protein
MDDEPQVEQLENRIDTLETTIEKMMPSRRDALKMGGAALVGGAAMSGTASADTVDDQVGTIGGPNEEVDLVSEDIDNSNQITTKDLVVNGTATGPFSDLNYELVDTIDSTISANSTKSLSVTEGGVRQHLLSFNFEGDGNGDETFLRFNFDTSSAYNFNVLETNSIEARTGQTKLEFIQQQSKYSYTGSYLISKIGPRITISGTGFALPEFNRYTLLNGTFANDILNLTSINIIAGASPINLSGDAKIELFGRI